MLALARLQRKFRLLESPYRTPQTLVGGPRADAALMAVSGPTATTKAMGEGSTQSQHLVQTEVPPKVLAGWLASGPSTTASTGRCACRCGRTPPAPTLLELSVLGRATRSWRTSSSRTLQDRRGRGILSVRDQNTFDTSLRRKRLMTLLHLFLIHRYKAAAIHYLTPTEDNQRQARAHAELGLFDTYDEVGEIIVADVDRPWPRSSSPAASSAGSSGSRSRRRPRVGRRVRQAARGGCLADGRRGRFGPLDQSCSLSQVPTFGHRFWLAERPTTIPTCPPSTRISDASSLPTRWVTTLVVARGAIWSRLAAMLRTGQRISARRTGRPSMSSMSRASRFSW